MTLRSNSALSYVADEARVLPDIERTPEEVCLATFWRQATPGTGYLRCQMPARHLPGQSLHLDYPDVQWKNEEKGLVEMPRQRGTAVWQFLGDDSRARLALQMQDQGIRTLIEVDDNYLWSPGRWQGGWYKTHQEAMTKGHGYSHEQHRHLVGLVNGVLVATPYLAEKYAEYTDYVYVARNSVDPWDWRAIPKVDDGTLRIGYAGSTTHVFDWPQIKKALKWADRQRGAEVVVMGFKPPAYSGRLFPWTNVATDFRKNLGLLDVGLCPLEDVEWNRSKSDVKALEYAMAGVLPIVSRTEPYRPWWERGWPSAQTPEEWDKIIRYAVRNPDWVKEMAAQAKAYVLAERTIQSEIPKWREAVLGAA